MERRDFIIKSGLFITATAFSKIGRGAASETESQRDNYSQFNQPILQALAIGLNTPSAHNTQAFKFRILNDYEAEIYLDESRLLPRTDPPSRQLHISIGCFIEIVSIGSTLISYKTDVIYFPQGDYKTSDFGKMPVARISLSATDTAVHPFANFIFKRFTSRLPYSGEMITREAFDKMKQEAKPTFSKLIFQNEEKELVPYLQIFKAAMKVESNTLATNEETRKMWRFTDEEVRTYRNGLTWEAQGMHGIGKFFAKTFAKNTQESWNAQANIDKGLTNFSKGVETSKGIVYWITETNTVRDWVNCGRDIINFWLVLTKNNLYCHPLNQAIQEYAEVDALRTQLDKMLQIQTGQKIQMIVRIGKSPEPYVSFRRHLKALIIS